MVPSSHSPRAVRAPVKAASALLVVAVFSVCADSTGPVEVRGSQSHIFLYSTRAGDVDEFGSPVGDIYRMNEDGSDVQRLTEQSALYRFLRLSPDGTKLTFYSSLGGCYDIFVLDLDSTSLTQLTGVTEYERCNEMPHWSPDGSKIVFMSSRHPELGWDVYVVNADGTGAVNVSNNPSTDPATSADATDGWSPDGRVVLRSHRDGTQRTYLVQPDGTGLTPLFGSGDYLFPEWSPNGAKVFACSEGEGDWECYVMDADGSDAVNVTNGPAYDGPSQWASSSWSPDGAQIAFRSMRTGDAEIFVVSPDGTGLVNVTADPGTDVFLGWSSDGTRVLFASDRSGTEDLYAANADGSGLVKLTTLSDPDDLPQAIWVGR